MPQPTTQPAPRLIELRGPSGKCYGELDAATGVIIFRRGKLPAERIDLTPYFKAVRHDPK